VGSIRVLPDSLINRIAAGEVVERPASVVKELVENAIDARARTIDVRLVHGGKASIEVRDDGCGMDRDDALLAIERHATSKLEEPADLERIVTLGFRGEALSSIAAVSRFTLRTARVAGEGAEVEVDCGRVVRVSGIGHPQGTTVRIERLFANVPARRKFLRADATELAHIARGLTRAALAFPDRRFRLSHGDRSLIATEPAADLLQRVVELHGVEFADKLLAFEFKSDDLWIRGFAGRPVDGLPRRDAQHLFVNGRPVQDRTLSHAISQAYGNVMAPGRHPAIFLFIELDPAAVDVNVHPQKTEVRFRDASRIHERVRATLLESLSTGDAVPSYGQLRPRNRDWTPAVRDAVVEYLARHDAVPPSPDGRLATREAGEPRGPLQAEPASPGGGEQAWRAPLPLAQFRDSYIVAQDEQGLVLVDQHAAHERVLYERYLEAAENDSVEVQRLMFPITLELAPQDLVLLENECEEFGRLGLRVEPFGERTVRLDGIPALAAGVEPEAFLRELLGQAGAVRAASTGVPGLRRRLVTNAACQAAIKINHPLTLAAMQGLLEDLYRTSNPTTCPHGRPVLFRLSQEEIERTFRRR